MACGQGLEGTEQGAAGYLTLVDEPTGLGIDGAILVVNGSGHPLAFCYNRGTFGRPPFWQGTFGRRYLVRLLTSSLLEACPIPPDVLLLPRDDHELGPEDLDPPLPLGIADGGAVRWLREGPHKGSAGAAVVSALISHEMLSEPFERSYQGLQQACDQP
jgi:hypothetical protein